jgi:endonuclease YncB( thermonuclease family)
MANMLILLFGVALVLLLIFPTFPTQSYGHRSGCHAAHSCPSDSGSYVCGDTGNFSQCPGNESEDNNDKSKKKKVNTDKSKSSSRKNNPTLPSKTSSEGIEISGPINYVVDGDTLDVNQIRIRLSLVNTPEVGEPGFDTAKNFVEKLCLDKNGEVDIDDGQRQGSFGREIGVVYCDGVNLNSELMSKGYAVISTEFCDVSEFSVEPWAKSSCQIGTSDENENNSPIRSDQDSSSLSTKQEQQVPSDSDSSESNKAQSEDTKQKESYQLIVYLDGAYKGNNKGDNFKIIVYDSQNKTILSAKPTIDFNDNHQKISPRKGYPIIYELGQNPKDIRVCAQQENMLNGRSNLHDDCFPIKQNIQKTYWYTIFDYGQIDGFEAD